MSGAGKLGARVINLIGTEMILLLYLATILLAGIVLASVLAKLFFAEFPADKNVSVPFFSSWLRFPKNKERVEERVRGFLSGLYYVQAVCVLALIVILIFGDYSL